MGFLIPIITLLRSYYFLLSVLISLAFVSCNSSQEKAIDKPSFFPFISFNPDVRILNFELNSPMAEVFLLMDSLYGAPVYKGEVINYHITKFNLDIVFNEENNLRDYTVFIKDTSMLKNGMELKNFLKSNAVSFHENKQYSIFNYLSKDYKYKVTFLQVEGFIRLQITTELINNKWH